MTNFWLLLLVIGFLICLLAIKKQRLRIEKLERWRQMIEQHAATVPEQVYV